MMLGQRRRRRRLLFFAELSVCFYASWAQWPNSFARDRVSSVSAPILNETHALALSEHAKDLREHFENLCRMLQSVSGNFCQGAHHHGRFEWRRMDHNSSGSGGSPYRATAISVCPRIAQQTATTLHKLMK